DPAGAVDTLHALRTGSRADALSRDTFFDGSPPSLAEPNFRILSGHGAPVLAVCEADAPTAMPLPPAELRPLVEPPSASALAAVRGDRARFAGKRVGIVLTGGNVDPSALPWSAP